MLEIATGSAARSSYAGKSLGERLAGRFYTPSLLADDLAERMLEAFDGKDLAEVRASDPFCGDGRLVLSLLRAASTRRNLSRLKWKIELRDLEQAALQKAAYQVNAIASILSMDVDVQTILGDTFTSNCKAQFDLIISNPPWELLKPDRRETAHLSSEELEIYKRNLRTNSRKLDEIFPDARGEGAWGGWGTNLARCGWDLCLRKARPGGVVGIILPSTLLGDQTSMPMRRKAFATNRVVDIACYPSEAKLFERVDQPVVALTFVKGRNPKGEVNVRSFDAERNLESRHRISISPRSMESRGWAIPSGPAAAISGLLDHFASLPDLASLESDGERGLWLGREIDESQMASKLMHGLDFPFVKGRMIQRHEIVESPSTSVRRELCETVASIAYYRVVWRDVARASSKRRMIGTIIPPGWVAGNSLHVGYFRDGNLLRTQALHALLSSLVLEAQVRTRLTTGHMSLGVVRQAKIPAFDAGNVRLLGRIGERALEGGGDASIQSEVDVAKLYGLNRDDMAGLLAMFPKITDVEKDELLAVTRWKRSLK